MSQEYWDLFNTDQWDDFTEDNWDTFEGIFAEGSFYLDISNYVSSIIYGFNQVNSLSSSIYFNLENLITANQNDVLQNQNTNTQLILSSSVTSASSIFSNYSDPLLDPILSNFTVSLQNYIINNFGDLNTFISSSDIQVTQLFANYSGSLGYPIDSENIDA